MFSAPLDIKAIASERVLRLHLTGILIDVLDASDLDTALAFAFKYGGRQVSIPLKRVETCELAMEFGEPVVRHLSGLYGGSKKVVAQGPFSRTVVIRLQALTLLERGFTLNEVASELRMPRNTVRCLVARYRRSGILGSVGSDGA